MLRFFLALAMTAAAMNAASGERPNVLLICVDDLKPALGCYGDALARTPHIDRLAARGMRFEAAYCNQAVCAPSRNNLMLGSRSTSLGIYNLSTNFRVAVPNAVTLTQYFMRHGWRAEGMGKILHVGHGNTNDEASWTSFHKEKLVEYVLPASTGGKLTREEAFFSNQKGGGPNSALPRGAAWEAPAVGDNAYGDGRLAEQAIRRLQAAKAAPGVPVFLAVGFARPHLPFTAPKKYWDLYDASAFSLAARTTPPEGAPRYAGKTTGELNQYEPIPPGDGGVPEDVQRTLIHGYYASISYMDAQVGRIIAEVDRLGLAEKTIVVLWGDHGWHLGDHGMWTKHTNYEQAVRIPIIMVAPGVARPGSRTTALVETVDIYPTLCDLAGLPAPKEVPQPMDGISLVPILRDAGATVRDHASHAYPRNRGSHGDWLGRAVRTAKHRLVEWKKIGAAPETAELELYDYERDPGETKNVAAEQADAVRALRAILAKHPEAKPPVAAR